MKFHFETIIFRKCIAHYKCKSPHRYFHNANQHKNARKSDMQSPHINRHKKTLVKVMAFTMTMVCINGCAANIASYEHFPKIDNEMITKIDSSQSKSEKSHFWPYNCNFENDYIAHTKNTNYEKLISASKNALRNSKFTEITFNSNDSTVTGCRKMTFGNSKHWQKYT